MNMLAVARLREHTMVEPGAPRRWEGLRLRFSAAIHGQGLGKGTSTSGARLAKGMVRGGGFADFPCLSRWGSLGEKCFCFIADLISTITPNMCQMVFAVV
jgi:hypothetical protein